MNILITGVGGPTPRSFARALKISRYRTAALFGTDIHNHAIGLYDTDLFKACFLTPRSREEFYWESMESIIEDNEIDLAIILPEAEVETWSIRQAEGDLPCPALIPELSIVNNVLNKGKLSDVLIHLNLVPDYVRILPTSIPSEHRILKSLSYPYWIRSSTGSSGLGSFKISSHMELLQWISLNPSVTEFLASNFLSGRNLACKLLYWNGNLVRSAVAERVEYIMSKVAPSGITGNTSFGRLINDPDIVSTVVDAMDYLFQVSAAKKHGFFTVDLKEDERGKPYITEINIRHVAFTSVFAEAGANFCSDTVALLSKDSLYDLTYRRYQFEEGLVFLREVDSLPILVKEDDLL